MLRSLTTVVLAFALGVLPVVHDVCGPECEMGEAPVILAVAMNEPAEAECPLHPAEDQAPRHEDGCTHDHGTVREAPESPSALAPSVPQSLDLPVAAFSGTFRHIVAGRRGHAVVSPPADRAPHRLALRI